jgi:hypothetical protein
LAIWL